MAGFEDAEKGHTCQDAGKGKKTDSVLESPERSMILLTPWF